VFEQLYDEDNPDNITFQKRSGLPNCEHCQLK
jgi:hypothetical protein